MDIYEPLEEFLFKTQNDEQSSDKESTVKTPGMINQELAFREMHSTKTTLITCDKFTLAECAFYPVIGYLIHRGLNMDKFQHSKMISI